jgi:hypothetical protein
MYTSEITATVGLLQKAMEDHLCLLHIQNVAHGGYKYTSSISIH